MAPRDAPRFVNPVPLGEGGQATVVRVTDVDLGRPVAIKRLRDERLTPSDVTRFVREVRLIGKLEHPNITPVYDVDRGDDDALYAVMKWVEGEPLSALIERLRDGDQQAHRMWGFEERTRLFLEICRGVAYANEHGVLHRDLSANNVMVSPDGSVQIIDWGLAHERGRDQQIGEVVGSPAYMSPEQATGLAYTERSEVFSLGALFWEFLTLRPLWYGEKSTKEMVEYAATRELPVPFHMRAHPVQGHVPSHLSWFVHRATRPKPFERFETVKAMIDDLQGRTGGDFPVQCPATFQRRTLMGVVSLLDRYPNGFPVVATVGVLGALSWAVVLGALAF